MKGRGSIRKECRDFIFIITSRSDQGQRSR